jgi:ADP-ribose pyrophosphatase YjhB (NUDIX family)
MENYWWTPGGSQKDNERLDETAMRELSEETGLECSIERTLVAELASDRPFITITFLGFVIGGTMSVDNDPDKTTAEVKYFSKDSIPVDKLWMESDKIILGKGKFSEGEMKELMVRNGFES